MIHFQASISKGWIHKWGGFVFDSHYYRHPVYRRLQDNKINEFIRKRFSDFPLYNMEANLMQAAFIDEKQVLVGGIQPNLILARVLGAELICYPDKDADVLGYPLKDISTVNELPSIEMIIDHPYIRELTEQIGQIQYAHPELDVIPPFFWDRSGRATIHGILTTSLKLIGEKAFLMFMMDPDLIHPVHQWITDVYISLINYFAGRTRFPVNSVHVGECSGTMISNDQFAEFITPYVSQIGKTFGNIRLHSCGPSDHILDAISEIDQLSVIDTGSNTSIAKIRKMMGDDFEINIEPPLKLMLYDATERDILSWLDQILEENRDGPLKLELHIEPDYSIGNCLLIYNKLKNRGLIMST
ncbi:MAG: hypothetical protein KFF73_07375 [Cyclobacteriaceae bacterium]|nr:hypothetical protein [Cyclobacteriaceae bacterium]